MNTEVSGREGSLFLSPHSVINSASTVALTEPAQSQCTAELVEDGVSRMEILMTVSKFASFCTMVSLPPSALMHELGCRSKLTILGN